MKLISSLASVSLLVIALAACGSPAEKADGPAAAENAAMPVVVADPPAADATPEAAPAQAETPAAAASTSAATAPTPELTIAPTMAPKPAASRAAAPAAAPTTLTAATAPKPPIFAVCGACHAVAAGQDGIGPSLAGVFNAKAGHASTHQYSPAMKNSGLTWNEATLDRYLKDPRAVVPGTTMSYGGLKSDAQRKAVIDYLKTL